MFDNLCCLETYLLMKKNHNIDLFEVTQFDTFCRGKTGFTLIFCSRFIVNQHCILAEVNFIHILRISIGINIGIISPPENHERPHLF